MKLKFYVVNIFTESFEILFIGIIIAKMHINLVLTHSHALRIDSSGFIPKRYFTSN